MTFSSFAVAAKASSGKVVDRLGDATLQKATNIGEWTGINVGNRIREKDQIRTGVEAHVSIALADGSSIIVQENSLVEFTTLQAENGIQTAFTDVKTGKVKFDAQKQHSGGSFKFKTATATAAIRGTDGMFGKTIKEKVTYLSINRGNGLLKHNKSSVECNVDGGQTAVFDEKGDKCKTFDVKSSGNEKFVAALDTLLDNENLTEEQLNKAIMQLDSTLQSQLNAAVSSLTCSFEQLEDTITVSAINLKGACAAGVKLSIAGATIENAANGFELPVSWAPTAEGPKKFNATCTGSLEYPCETPKKGKKPKICKKDVSIECGTLTTYYKNPAVDSVAADSIVQDTVKKDTVVAKPFAITTSSPATVCNPGSVTIEGTFDQTDPTGTLYVKLGSYTSRNLVPLSANGEFSHTISINDVAGNWNEGKVTVEYNGASGKHNGTVLLNINKSCKQVNMKRPVLTFSNANSTACIAMFGLTGATDDLVIVQRQTDGTTDGESTLKQDSKIAIKMVPGVHTYTIIATDQAGNSANISKILGCYPQHIPHIDVAGKPYEFLRPPPAPPYQQTTTNSAVQNSYNTIVQTLRFRLTGVLKQDPAQIKRIKITQDGKTLLDHSTNQISDLNYALQVTLARYSISVITIYVEMMNGKKISETKTYEVN